MRAEPRIVLNFIAFQAAWFACVLGGANDRALAGTMVVAAVIGLHLALAQRPLPEALLIAVAALIGLVWDSGLVALGLMSYPTGNFAPGLAPYWIVAMWALFATSLNLSMAWLKDRAWLAALFGAVGGPLAYLAGERLGGLQMPDPVLALAAQALGWAVLLPVLTRLAMRLNGFGPASPSVWSRLPQEARSNV
jgi:hypothetical protein